VGEGEGVGAGAGDGVGEGVGDGVLLPPPPPLGFGFGFFFGLTGAGSEPEGVNAAKLGAPATATGFTAEGAAPPFLPPALALPIPNAAPKATTAATAPIAANRPGVIRDTSRSCAASTNPGWYSGSWRP
jgi:hypothetical protein